MRSLRLAFVSLPKTLSRLPRQRVFTQPMLWGGCLQNGFKAGPQLPRSLCLGRPNGSQHREHFGLADGVQRQRKEGRGVDFQDPLQFLCATFLSAIGSRPARRSALSATARSRAA